MGLGGREWGPAGVSQLFPGEPDLDLEADLDPDHHHACPPASGVGPFEAGGEGPCAGEEFPRLLSLCPWGEGAEAGWVLVRSGLGCPGLPASLGREHVPACVCTQG